MDTRIGTCNVGFSCRPLPRLELGVAKHIWDAGESLHFAHEVSDFHAKRAFTERRQAVRCKCVCGAAAMRMFSAADPSNVCFTATVLLVYLQSQEVART